MKIIILAVILSLPGTGCNNKADKKEEVKGDTATTRSAPADTTKTPMPGSDRDEHGCIGSAGYTWSVVKNDCIRIFEDGTRLNAAEAVKDKTTSAFAVFATDHKKVELFIPVGPGSGIILEQDKSDSKKWDGTGWSLEKTANGLVLKKDGAVQYTE